jgi:putative transposase
MPTVASRATILLLLHAELKVARVARVLRHARSYVHHVIALFLQGGLDALADGRKVGVQRIPRKGEVLALLPKLVEKQPRDFGWRRSTWSIELVAKEVQRQLGVRVSRSQMGRLLHQEGCRRVCPKQSIALAAPDRAAAMALLRAELDALPSDAVVLYGDEVDLHLNPKVGLDWAPKGMRKELVTPGQNSKWYMAGAYNPATKNLITVDGPKKTSDLFILLLQELATRYRMFGTVHLVVDNYIIHKSKKTQKALSELKGKVVLHFLPPYSPDYNPIERVWWDLHATVTRNHRCPDMESLLAEVRDFVRDYARRGGRLAALDRQKAHTPLAA